MEIGVQYMGLCCGGRAHFLRTMAETLGRTTPASKYGAVMSLHHTQTTGNSERAWSSQKYAEELMGNGKHGEK